MVSFMSGPDGKGGRKEGGREERGGGKSVSRDLHWILSRRVSFSIFAHVEREKEEKEGRKGWQRGNLALTGLNSQSRR